MKKNLLLQALLLLSLTAAHAQGDNKEIINRHCFKQLDAFNAKKK